MGLRTASTMTTSVEAHASQPRRRPQAATGGRRGVAEGPPGGLDALAPGLPCALVELPVGLVGLDEEELICHVPILAEGCDNERTRVRSRAGAPGATSGQGRSRSAIRARSSSSASSWWRPSTWSPTGSPSNGAGRDRHRRVAVDVGRDGERALVAQRLLEPVAPSSGRRRRWWWAAAPRPRTPRRGWSRPSRSRPGRRGRPSSR